MTGENYPKLGESIPQEIVDGILEFAGLYNTRINRFIEVMGSQRLRTRDGGRLTYELPKTRAKTHKCIKQLSEWVHETLVIEGDSSPDLRLQFSDRSINGDVHYDLRDVSTVAFSNQDNWLAGTVVLSQFDKSDFEQWKWNGGLYSDNRFIIDEKTGANQVSPNRGQINNNIKTVQPENGQVISFPKGVFHAEPRWPKVPGIVRVACLYNGPVE